MPYSVYYKNRIFSKWIKILKNTHEQAEAWWLPRDPTPTPGRRGRATDSPVKVECSSSRPIAQGMSGKVKYPIRTSHRAKMDGVRAEAAACSLTSTSLFSPKSNTPRTPSPRQELHHCTAKTRKN